MAFNVLIRNRAVGAAVTALQQLEGAIQKAAARMEESSRGPISLEVGPAHSIAPGMHSWHARKQGHTCAWRS